MSINNHPLFVSIGPTPSSARASVGAAGTGAGSGPLQVIADTWTSGVHSAMYVEGAANTGVTASTEVSDVVFNLSRTVTWATGALTNQRALKITAPTYAFAAASTITNAVTVFIEGPPGAGTNATITNGYALFVGSGTTKLGGALVLGGTVSCGSNDFDAIGIANVQVVRGAASDLSLRPAVAGGTVVITKADGTTKAIESDATGIGFYGAAPVARQLLATGGGATVDQVITALQALGLLRQS